MMAGMPLIVSTFASKSFARTGGFALLRGLELLLQFLLVREQRFDFLFQFVNRRIHFARERFDQMQLRHSRVAISFKSGNGFDAPDARRNRAFADDAEQTDLARRARVRAAAKFHRITIQLPCAAADLDDADGVAVFVAEELHHVLAVLHVGVRDFRPRDAGVFEDAFVDELLDVGDLRGRERRAVEIEGQLVRPDERTFLRRLLARDFVQRPMQQMRDRVMPLDGVATSFVNARASLPAPTAGSVAAFDEMQPTCCRTSACVMKCSHVFPDFCVSTSARDFRRRNFAGVADLAAHLGVKRRRVQHDGGFVFELTTSSTLRGRFQFFKADKFCRRGRFDLRKRNDFFFLRGAGAGALFFHQLFKTVLVHGQTAFARHQFGEVERETVGVVKFETPDLNRRHEISNFRSFRSLEFI